MRKKIIFIIICFVSMFILSDRVMAAEDHSLNYDIEEFSLSDDNQLTISGWAFIHNYDNYGGMSVESEHYAGNNVDRNIYSSDAKLKISFYFSSDEGKSRIGEKEVDYINSDFTSLICYKAEGIGCDKGPFDKIYVYKNVRFSIRIDMNEIKKQISSSSKYSLYISAQLKKSSATPLSEQLAVDKDTATGFGNSEFEVSGLGEEVNVTGNHVTYGDYYYWLLSQGRSEYTYRFCYVNGKYYKKDADDPVRWYYLANGGDSYYDTVAYGLGSNNCGFEGRTSKRCVKPGNKSCNMIRSTFVKPTGKVSIKYKGEDDKYCNTISDSEINSCDGAPLDYVCNTMTVEKEGIKADVHLEEHAELYGVNANGEYVYYPNITVYAGGFLDFKFIYKDTVSWEFVDNERNNNLTSDQKQTIADAMSSYYVGLSGNNMYLFEEDSSLNANMPNSSIKENVKWGCSTEGSFTDINRREVVTICSFDIPEAYVKDGQVVYNSKSGYIATGLKNKFYIYRDYNLKQFKWNINSSNTLSTLKVRTDKDTITQLEININTSSNSNNSCYFNVKSDLYDYPDSGDPNTNREVAIVYRSIDESNPFPKISSYLNYPENWKIYYESVGNLDRVKSSFSQDIDYRTNVLTADAIRKLNLITTSYTVDDVDVGGNVGGVINGDFFDIYNAKHSKKGYYDKGSDTP